MDSVTSGMNYTLAYYTSVRLDFQNMDAAIRTRVVKSLQKKLKTRPLEFGTFLKDSLYPFLKLRIGNWRIIYSVDEKKKEVTIVTIGPRRNKEVYKEALRRIESK
jgi:mRNA interferase RelE/StbE